MKTQIKYTSPWYRSSGTCVIDTESVRTSFIGTMIIKPLKGCNDND